MERFLPEGIPTYDPLEFKALYNASPCIPFHLKGSCTDLDCNSVHGSAQFSKSGKEELLQFVRSSPCGFGVECTPTKVRDCLYIHICPRREHCDDSTCGFLAAAFEGKGHEPNQASKCMRKRKTRNRQTYWFNVRIFMSKREEARFARSDARRQR